MSQVVCEKHKTAYEDVDCYRCGGDGHTQSDIEEMDNPIAWHDDGNCYMCKGTGSLLNWSCPDCEQETKDLEDDEEYL